MDYNNVYEQEIDLKDLIFAVLHRWRMILAAAVVLALLLGGYKALRTYNHNNDDASILEAKAQYEKDLEAYNQRVSVCDHAGADLSKSGLHGNGSPVLSICSYQRTVYEGCGG